MVSRRPSPSHIGACGAGLPTRSPSPLGRRGRRLSSDVLAAEALAAMQDVRDAADRLDTCVDASRKTASRTGRREVTNVSVGRAKKGRTKGLGGAERWRCGSSYVEARDDLFREDYDDGYATDGRSELGGHAGGGGGAGLGLGVALEDVMRDAKEALAERTRGGARFSSRLKEREFEADEESTLASEGSIHISKPSYDEALRAVMEARDLLEERLIEKGGRRISLVESGSDDTEERGENAAYKEEESLTESYYEEEPAMIVTRSLPSALWAVAGHPRPHRGFARSKQPFHRRNSPKPEVPCAEQPPLLPRVIHGDDLSQASGVRRVDLSQAIDKVGSGDQVDMEAQETSIQMSEEEGGALGSEELSVPDTREDNRESPPKAGLAANKDTHEPADFSEAPAEVNGGTLSAAKKDIIPELETAVKFSYEGTQDKTVCSEDSPVECITRLSTSESAEDVVATSEGTKLSIPDSRDDDQDSPREPELAASSDSHDPADLSEAPAEDNKAFLSAVEEEHIPEPGPHNQERNVFFEGPPAGCTTPLSTSESGEEDVVATNEGARLSPLETRDDNWYVPFEAEQASSKDKDDPADLTEAPAEANAASLSPAKKDDILEPEPAVRPLYEVDQEMAVCAEDSSVECTPLLTSESVEDDDVATNDGARLNLLGTRYDNRYATLEAELAASKDLFEAPAEVNATFLFAAKNEEIFPEPEPAVEFIYENNQEQAVFFGGPALECSSPLSKSESAKEDFLTTTERARLSVEITEERALDIETTTTENNMEEKNENYAQRLADDAEESTTLGEHEPEELVEEVEVEMAEPEDTSSSWSKDDALAEIEAVWDGGGIGERVSDSDDEGDRYVGIEELLKNSSKRAAENEKEKHVKKEERKREEGGKTKKRYGEFIPLTDLDFDLSEDEEDADSEQDILKRDKYTEENADRYSHEPIFSEDSCFDGEGSNDSAIVRIVKPSTDECGDGDKAVTWSTDVAEATNRSSLPRRTRRVLSDNADYAVIKLTAAVAGRTTFAKRKLDVDDDEGVQKVGPPSGKNAGADQASLQTAAAPSKNPSPITAFSDTARRSNSALEAKATAMPAKSLEARTKTTTAGMIAQLSGVRENEAAKSKNSAPTPDSSVATSPNNATKGKILARSSDFAPRRNSRMVARAAATPAVNPNAIPKTTAAGMLPLLASIRKKEDGVDAVDTCRRVVEEKEAAEIRSRRYRAVTPGAIAHLVLGERAKQPTKDESRGAKDKGKSTRAREYDKENAELLRTMAVEAKEDLQKNVKWYSKAFWGDYSMDEEDLVYVNSSEGNGLEGHEDVSPMLACDEPGIVNTDKTDTSASKKPGKTISPLSEVQLSTSQAEEMSTNSTSSVQTALVKGQTESGRGSGETTTTEASHAIAAAAVGGNIGGVNETSLAASVQEKSGDDDIKKDTSPNAISIHEEESKTQRGVNDGPVSAGKSNEEKEAAEKRAEKMRLMEEAEKALALAAESHGAALSAPVDNCHERGHFVESNEIYERQDKTQAAQDGVEAEYEKYETVNHHDESARILREAAEADMEWAATTERLNAEARGIAEEMAMISSSAGAIVSQERPRLFESGGGDGEYGGWVAVQDQINAPEHYHQVYEQEVPPERVFEQLYFPEDSQYQNGEYYHPHQHYDGRDSVSHMAQEAHERNVSNYRTIGGYSYAPSAHVLRGTTSVPFHQPPTTSHDCIRVSHLHYGNQGDNEYFWPEDQISPGSQDYFLQESVTRANSTISWCRSETR